MKELDLCQSAGVIAGGDNFATDAGQYLGGFIVGYALAGGQLPIAMLLGGLLGMRQAMK
jgi:hypothetical protein